MRGSDQQQGHVFSYISPEQRSERSSAAGRNLDYLVFHSVLVGLKAEGKLPAETFLNSLSRLLKIQLSLAADFALHVFIGSARK